MADGGRTGAERRRSSRVELVAPARVLDIARNLHLEGTIVNVSVAGIGILLKARLEMDGPLPIAVEFELPPMPGWRHAQGEVVRQHRVGTGGSYVVGVEFFRVSKSLREELRVFVERHQAVRGNIS